MISTLEHVGEPHGALEEHRGIGEYISQYTCSFILTYLHCVHKMTFSLR